MDFIERLSEGFDEEIMAQFVNEYGLDVSGDLFLLKDSVERAKKIEAGLFGSINSFNQLLSDGIYISFDDFEHDTDARWFLKHYIKCAEEELHNLGGNNE